MMRPSVPPLAPQREPDFRNLLAVLERRRPDRPTLFEFFLNERLHEKLTGIPTDSLSSALEFHLQKMWAFRNAGYDYYDILLPGFDFPAGPVEKRRTVSQNEGAVIRDRKSFQQYSWMDPDAADWALLDQVAHELPPGMQLIVYGPSGVLENAINLVGYEALCMLIVDDPDLAMDIFGEIGSRLERYYSIAARHPAVGACISNDDWGFRTQTLFSPAGMRRFVFPWHKRIVQAIHAAGKPAILHSCGHFERVMDDIVNEMGYDARHSYEDTILPVEEAYERYHQRIAILGGIDVDFVCRASPEEVYRRSKAMLERTRERGAYALGTGNSVPEYVPDEGYFAMIRAALEEA
ncbi:uroporphyrinogen-III decarboxylase [Anaerolinea thermolimosa]|nr:uroporphyrinogen decarboxylase family protein [Anaerolinea thermolimosa]GAP07374.1 uroporphyrinogen-III decarboxylase [Anaerolinea thermolimosa]